MRLCISAFSAVSNVFLWKRPGDFQTIDTNHVQHLMSLVVYSLEKTWRLSDNRDSPWFVSSIRSIHCGLLPYSAYVISHFSKETNLQDAHECMSTHLPT